MDDKESFGLACEPAADLLQVRPQVPVLHIDQQRSRFEPPYGFQGSDKSVGRQDYLITLTDAAGGQPQDQRLSSRRRANDMRDRQEGGHLMLESPDLFAIDELRTFQQLVPVGLDLDTNALQFTG